jgi:hypothetical protein
MRRVGAQREGRRTVHDEVHPQDGAERGGQADQTGAQDRQDGADVRRRLEPDERQDVVVDPPAAFDRRDDRGEVVVGEDEVGGLLGDLGAGDPCALPMNRPHPPAPVLTCDYTSVAPVSERLSLQVAPKWADAAGRCAGSLGAFDVCSNR